MAPAIEDRPHAGTRIWTAPWTVKQQPLQVELGDLSLTISRQDHEWQLCHHWTRRGNSGAFSCDYLDNTPGDITGSLSRVAMETMTDTLHLRPGLADRPVVVRPYSALTIPGQNRITLYVSTPLWLGIEFAPGLRKELPLQQLSDTWMGQLTGQGELCYGSHTHARLDQNLLLDRPFRALSPITIHNKSAGDFTLERLSIPTPFLSLYAEKGLLVTEPIAIAMDSEKHQGVVEIGSPGDIPLISAARKKTDRGILVSAWENLFA